jgi:predicted transcriptional regulator
LPTTLTKTCENPRCSCSSCACADCKCGVATLGDLERRVMDILWAEPGREMTGRDVLDLLPGYAYTTVATVLDRLVHKELISRRMDGRTKRFAAAGTRADHTAGVMHDALVTARDPESALTSFAGTLSRSEAAALRRALGKS